MTTRITAAEIARAKEAAAEAGLCLSAIEKRPDGTVKLVFSGPGMSNDWQNPLDRLHHG